MATIEIRCQTVDKYRNTNYSNTKIQKIQKYTRHHCHPHCDNGESILGECRKGKPNNKYRNTNYSNTKIRKIQKYGPHHRDNGESILGECRKGKLNNQQSLPTTGWPPTATPCDNILEAEEETLIYKN